MSIVITVNAENGADARKELIELLGLSSGELHASVRGTDLQISLDRTKGIINEAEKRGLTVVDGGSSAIEVIQEEQPAAEEKKKRRTKAEIEAEKAALAANTGSEEPPASAETTAAPVEEKSAEPSHPDLPALQRVCAIMVRAGYKADAVKIIETVGKAPSSADVLPENRQAVIDALTELAKQQNVAL